MFPQILLILASTLLAPEAAELRISASSGGIKQVRILSEGGDVRIHAKRGERIEAKGRRSLGPATCRLEGERDARHSFVLRAKEASGAPCRIDLDVALPPTLSLRVEASEGNVFVSGLRQSLEVVLGSGNAVLGGVFPRLSAKLAEGSLSVQGLAGDAQLELEHGNAQLWYGLKPRGTAQLNVEHGNVTVTAPVRALNMATNVEAGVCNNPLDNSPEAPLKITGRIGHGNLTVRPAPVR